MKVIQLIASELTLLDANTNRVSLINIHDEFQSPQFPFLIPLFSVFALTEKENGENDECTCRVKISLDNEEILDSPLLLNYQGGDRHRSIIGLHGLVLTGPGALKIELLHDDEAIGSWLIPVKQLAPVLVVNGQKA
jgi:hypothetical protein